MRGQSTHESMSAGERRALPALRLRPPGPGGTDAVTWFGRGAMVLLALGVVACLWTAFRPQPVPELGPEPAIPAIPGAAPALASVEGRQSTLAALNKENIFSAERRPWSRQAIPETEVDAAKKGAAQQATGGKTPPPPGTKQQIVNGTPIGVTPESGIPEDLKKALAAVELKGVFVMTDGTPVAMIGFVHASNRAASMPYKAGDEFKDEQNPQQPWKVMAVDYPGSRAILSRAGHNVELVLYKSRTPEPTVSAAPGTIPPKGPPAVVPASRDEVLAQLRAAKVPEDQITALMAKLNEPDSPEALAIQAELARQAAAAAAKKADTSESTARPAPAGMESVLKMMQESAKSPQQPPAGASGDPGQRPQRGRRRGDPGPAPSQQPRGTGGSESAPGSAS